MSSPRKLNNVGSKARWRDNRWILNFRGWPNRFRPYISPWRQHIGSDVLERFPIWQACFIVGLRVFEAGPVYSGHWNTGDHVPDVHFRSAAAAVETYGIDQPYFEQSEFIEKPSPTHRQPLRNGTSSYEPPLCQLVENDWTNITRNNSVTSDRGNATLNVRLRVYLIGFDCASLLQLVPDNIPCGGSKPEVVFWSRSRVPEVVIRRETFHFDLQSCRVLPQSVIITLNVRCKYVHSSV